VSIPTDVRARGMRVAACFFLALLLALGTVRPTPVSAQGGAWGDDRGLEETIWAIQRARVVTRILYVTAHPDDEAGALLSYLARGAGANVSLLTLTRGEGGQNAVGPELGPQLAAIRSQELFEATQVQGVKLYFTRAPDFGYSKTMEETLRVWDDVALGDMVYVIRKLRPHIVINGWAGVRGGHGNHQASGYLTPKAVEAAADPKMFPEQITGGLQPWRPLLLLQPERGGGSGWTVPTNEISAIWEKSYSDFGIEALVHHRSQGVVGFAGSPFRRRPTVLGITGNGVSPSAWAELTGQDATPGKTGDAAVFPAIFEGPPAALAVEFPAAANALREPLVQVERELDAGRRAALQLNWAEAVKALGRAGRAVPKRRELPNSLAAREADRIEAELGDIRARIERALTLAAGLKVEARADRREVIAGESFTVLVETQARPGVLLGQIKAELTLPPGWKVAKEEPQQDGAVRFTVGVPGGAATPHAADEWMLPVPPALVEARVQAQAPTGEGASDSFLFEARVPVEALRATSTRADILPVVLAPAVTLALEPRQFLLHSRGTPRVLELLARVHHYGTHPAHVTLGLNAPPGWKVEAPAPVEFQGTGDQLVRFRVTPPAQVAAGETKLQAWATRDGERFTTSLEPLPSLPTRLWSEPAVASVRVLDLSVPAGLRVGYIAAENDPVPYALGQLGIRVEMLDEVALAFGDLSKFDAICIGIRAYELRSDLARANARLLDYARAGGTLVVQYQRQNPWNQINPAPYPATIGQPTIRTTDENSPVRLVAQNHPVLRFPNVITLDDFAGWIQERGLYYWGQWDKQYQPILGLRDPGEEETLGSLLYARVGKGVYIYSGLVFFRELPAGVPGAVRLFVNLLSQGKKPVASGE